jgi:L-alanine-DL-glutamate epimerase-like enolase superfamily enzyme
VRIESFATKVVQLPLPEPIGTAIHQMHSVGCVLVELQTDDGLIGQGFAFTLNGDRIRAFEDMASGFALHVVDHDPRDVTAVWSDLWRATNPSGHKGVTISAMSAIDVALWDIVGKAAGMPLSKIFGGMRDRIDTYATSGLWLSQSIDELETEAQRFVENGFWGMKVRVGSDFAEDDVTRVRAVREVVGPEVDLYVDANQAFTAKQAIRLGRQLEEFNLVWFEEPTSVHDLAGQSQVRAALDTPIASGETEYTRFGMQEILDARAVDVLMPDLQRVGGYSEMRHAASLASARNIPISTHFFTEYSLSVAGSTPGCVSVEHVDWFSPLFNESVELDRGQLVIPDRPGTGFTFDPDAVAHFGI